MKEEYFPTKNWYNSKRNMELFEDRVQPCHYNVFQCRALGWLHTLYARLAKNIKFEIWATWKCQALGWLLTKYTGLAKNIKFEILGCLEALEL